MPNQHDCSDVLALVVRRLLRSDIERKLPSYYIGKYCKGKAVIVIVGIVTRNISFTATLSKKQSVGCIKVIM